MPVSQHSKVGHRVITSPAAPGVTTGLLSLALISHVSLALATISLFQTTLQHFTWVYFSNSFILVSGFRYTTNGLRFYTDKHKNLN